MAENIIGCGLLFICMGLILFSIKNDGIIRKITIGVVILTSLYFFWGYYFYGETPMFLEAHRHPFLGFEPGTSLNPIDNYSFGEVFKHFLTDWFV